MKLGRYRIIYSNGVTQVKDLISQDDFKNTLAPGLMEVYRLTQIKAHEVAKELKSTLKKQFGDNYFTSESPIGKAMFTGRLVLVDVNYDEPCTVVRIGDSTDQDETQINEE